MNKKLANDVVYKPGVVLVFIAIVLLVFFAYGAAVQARNANVNLRLQDDSTAQDGSATPNEDPDFSTVEDPLQGDYELFSVDDLLVQRPTVANLQTTISNYILLTENNTVAAEQQVDVLTADCTNSTDWPQQTRIGRFFALDRDVQLILHPSANAGSSDCSGSNNLALTIHPQHDNTDAVSTLFTASAEKLVVAVDDLNSDGFEDMFILNDSHALVATAVDVQDPAQGMQIGPAVALNDTIPPNAFDPVTGDFNADGLVDAVWIGSQKTLKFATICPGPVSGTMCAGAAPLQVMLNPLQSAATPIQLDDTSGCFAPSRHRALAAGDFSSRPGDGLVVLYQKEHNHDCFVEAAWYEFNGNFTLANGQPTDIQRVAPEGGNSLPTDIFATAAPLDWFSDGDQVIIGMTMNVITCSELFQLRYDEVVAVISFDSSEMTISKHQGKSTGCYDGNPFADPPLPWVNGIAVGHFATMEQNPGSQEDFNLQIATLINATGVVNVENNVRIYEVNAPTDFTPTLVSETPLTAPIPPRDGQSRANWLQAGDLQGRSARLGPPTVLRVSNHSQPTVVIGAPPMHVDYVETIGEAELFNFTTAPDAYNASYQLSTTQSTESSSTNTTSYSYGYTEEVEQKFRLGVPLISSVSGTFKQAWEQQYETTSEDYQFQEDEFKFQMKTATGLTDVLYYTSSEFNIYIYPVLGETVCPNDQPHCTPDEELPLVVQFSGPESTGEVSVQGSATEWYQPVHEPGQLFSYPWDQTQLEKRMESTPQYLSTPLTFFTGELAQTFDLEWSVGTGSEQSIGTSQEHSFETNNSLSMGEVPKEGSGLEIKGSVDYNNSNAAETLNTASSSLSASKGVSIEKSNTLADSGLYSYRVSAYLMGQEAPQGTVQDIEMEQPIQTYGPLQAAFTADPTANNVGAWWQDSTNPYREHVDIALNHPARWSWELFSIVNETDTACLIVENSDYNCVEFNEPQPDHLWTSKFYWMRGLLLTVGGATGLQRNWAEVGDNIFLQARVYNYSLRDLDSDSEILVRFYRQEVDGTTPTGDSELIAEEIVAPLPGFRSLTNPDAPNWQTVTTSFTATPELADKYYIFWVLVWAEDGQGNMVHELPAHGLSEIPGPLTSIVDVPLEQIEGGVETETSTYSNNVGFLKATFYISPQSSLQSAPNTPDSVPELEIHNLTVTPNPAALGEQLVVSGDIFAKGGEAQAVVVHFHEDDPEDESDVFDVENLPYIRPNDSYHFRVPHREVSCGTHDIWVIVNHRQDNEVRAKTSFVVPCLSYFPVFAASAGQE
ncbi:MAG: VCBS repeat-containing protein [Candidatus Promineifilaceae bacterium]|nr:VCBS repeat-containing protein [Candidatus Promineifilaceae bacterium]